MKFGLFSHVAWPEGTEQKVIYDDKIEQIVFAEEMGYDSRWIAEHHFTRYGIVSSLPVFLGHVAAKTKRIRLGTAVSVLPLPEPITLAEDYALVDVLSDGRLDLAVGRGFASNDHRVFGVDRQQNPQMYVEAIDVIRGLWTTPRYSFHGQFYNFDDVTLTPMPVQKPHPPIYMAAAYTRGSVEMAVDRRLPIIVGFILDHEPAMSWYREYKVMAAQRGFTVDTSFWPFQRFVYVAETEKEAREAPRDWVMWLWEMIPFIREIQTSDVHADFNQFRRTSKPSMTYEDFLEKVAVFGTADTVAAKIKWMRDKYDIHHFIGDFSTGAMEQSMALRNMELFAKKVIPQLR